MFANGGSYSVGETGVTGYEASYSADCSGTLTFDEVKKILDDAKGRRELWERLQFSLDGEPDPWFDFGKAAVDARQLGGL